MSYGSASPCVTCENTTLLFTKPTVTSDSFASRISAMARLPPLPSRFCTLIELSGRYFSKVLANSRAIVSVVLPALCAMMMRTVAPSSAVSA